MNEVHMPVGGQHGRRAWPGLPARPGQGNVASRVARRL
ncbi:hypothetical protein SXCC_02393 [Gluconacetobacter sp. SXCC-1]|nr:hypothetical protein SXCC_02393 [Gluconacetobacter sp. SXCC-1]